MEKTLSDKNELGVDVEACFIHSWSYIYCAVCSRFLIVSLAKPNWRAQAYSFISTYLVPSLP